MGQDFLVVGGGLLGLRRGWLRQGGAGLPHAPSTTYVLAFVFPVFSALQLQWPHESGVLGLICRLKRRALIPAYLLSRRMCRAGMAQRAVATRASA
ncbi:hypothetical protein AOA75_13805 [Pseudomonas aeruginosa]|nr:hypothetical protein AOA75_13805 [Pseudomonas aeruginosa]